MGTDELKTIGFIRQWINHSVLCHVAERTNARSLWRKLEAMYEPKNAENLAYMTRRLVNPKFKEAYSVAEYFIDIRSLELGHFRDEAR
ncbi:hypothetical protein RJ639_010484 [Escallonia herrerae]|uniref:Uncharacterized protein n=1 Tax=Escallonia herrerae TaxID=1293975 RepID=A0AA88VM15_9ASTE|nr:hypothetical protein RJ639_010484 [Escallonia herrerae]